MNEIVLTHETFDDLIGAMAIYYHLSSWKETTNGEHKQSMWKAQEFFSKFVDRYYTGKIPEKDVSNIVIDV